MRTTRARAAAATVLSVATAWMGLVTAHVATGSIAGVGTEDSIRDAGFSIRDSGANAFGFPAPALSAEDRRAFAVGNSFFKQNWVEAPSSTSSRDGLGPFFHARSCSGCHVKDGRSRPPEEDEVNREGLLLRIGVRAPRGPDLPHPAFGEQVHEDSVLGVAPEARVRIRWLARSGAYADGSDYELVEPRYELTESAYGPLGDQAVVGGRTAPHLIGLGLLEAVPTSAILALADEDDANEDGISGRPHFIGESRVLGRFGWRATQPDVRAQTAAALANDMGITSTLFPSEDFGAAQIGEVEHVTGGSPEIDDWTLDRLTFYTRALAVPKPRVVERAEFVRGHALFHDFGCAACHVPRLESGDSAFHPSFARRVFEPYTDLLLHDMGPELADGKRDGDALPSEWRTAPLWGIGLVPVVNGHSRYLHDGRARDLAEAILWHGGEALRARERFRVAERSDREALIAFVESI